MSFFHFQYNQAGVRQQYAPGPQFMQNPVQNQGVPQQQIFFAPPMPGQQFAFAPQHPYHLSFPQPHLAAQMQQQLMQQQQPQQSPAVQAPAGQQRPHPTPTPPSQVQPQLAIAPHSMGPTPMMQTSLPSQMGQHMLYQQQQQHQQQQQQQQQVNQTVISRPPLQRPRSKAIPIVDPTTQCEIDISAAKTPAPAEPATKASTPLLTQPEESASEVRLIELWNFKSCLVFDFFKEANYFNTIVISS
jgi:hypothetical protein